jgi:hypothetical protein
VTGQGERLPLWGDFGGACLANSCRVTPELFLPGASAMGLPRSASYLLGTWRTQDGDIFRFLRGIAGYRSDALIAIFSNRGAAGLERQDEAERGVYRGGIVTSLENDAARYAPVGDDRFACVWDETSAVWREGDLLAMRGALCAEPTQWYNPWRGGGGGYAVTLKYRAKGSILGVEADGFFAHEIHFFPPGLDFMNSPYGFGGREIHWGHMATAFADGTMIDASLAIGADSWGFALLTDEAGRRHATTQIEVRADVRPSGYPERIFYRFLDQEWIWRIADRGERARATAAAGGLLGAEGVLTRVGDKREVVTAMGTIDWWSDGREKAIPPLS